MTEKGMAVAAAADRLRQRLREAAEAFAAGEVTRIQISLSLTDSRPG
jgi:hypothetical protein